MPLLSHPNDKIVNEVLAFLDALLESGNINVQKGFTELKKFREHQMFPTLQTMLRRAAVVYKERCV